MSNPEVIERVWSAPIDLVWRLWTTAEGIAAWFGPRGWQVEVEELEVTEGGVFRYAMWPTKAETVAAMEAKGQPVRRVVESTVTVVDPPHRFTYRSPWGADSMTTAVEFTEVEGGTKMVLRVSATKPEMLGGAMMGWKSSLGRFEEALG